MEPTPQIKPVYAIIVSILVFVIAVALYLNYQVPRKDSEAVVNPETAPENVVVEYAAAVNGAFSAPAGLPQDIPVEKNEIIESATTQYPDQNAKQFSLNYISSKTVAEKYKEYKNYMVKEGYTFEEGNVNSSVLAIFGEKANANLTVVISNSNGETLVQLSYLLKSV